MGKAKELHVYLTTREMVLGWCCLCVQLVVLPTVLSMLQELLLVPMNDAGLNFLSYAVNFLLVFLVFRRFLLKSLENAGKKFWQFLQAAILGFVAYWLCSWVIQWVIQKIMPGFYNVNDAEISQMVQSRFWLMAAGTVLLVPLTEECLYRGLIFSQIRRKNRWAAYIVSVLVFGAIHVLPYWGSGSPLMLALCFLQYLPAGIWLAWSYEKANTIFAPILIHMVINVIAIYALR